MTELSPAAARQFPMAQPTPHLVRMLFGAKSDYRDPSSPPPSSLHPSFLSLRSCLPTCLPAICLLLLPPPISHAVQPSCVPLLAHASKHSIVFQVTVWDREDGN